MTQGPLWGSYTGTVLRIDDMDHAGRVLYATYSESSSGSVLTFGHESWWLAAPGSSNRLVVREGSSQIIPPEPQFTYSFIFDTPKLSNGGKVVFGRPAHWQRHQHDQQRYDLGRRQWEQADRLSRRVKRRLACRAVSCLRRCGTRIRTKRGRSPFTPQSRDRVSTRRIQRHYSATRAVRCIPWPGWDSWCLASGLLTILCTSRKLPARRRAFTLIIPARPMVALAKGYSWRRTARSGP